MSISSQIRLIDIRKILARVRFFVIIKSRLSKVIEISRLVKSDSTIDNGIISLANFVFCKRNLAETKLFVALDREVEKNCQGSKPTKRNKK